MMNSEIFRPIVGYESLYSVSNIGRVKSHISNRILKPLLRKTGYLEICLYKNKRKKYYLLHRVVAETFLEPIEGANEINHIDGDKTNNCIENIEWSTRKQNLQHAYENGLRKDDVSPKRIKCYPKDNKSKVIFFNSIYQAARKLKISQGNICMVCKGRRPTASGYIFKYA